ncbi:hypothetical protein [Bradyrhizobium sp. SSUT77]|uniref:hypothetical protein n=1 Tax=Bradyrhizobium sp. SSUT77 TaxID=3040603 RepID=UPI00244969B6|nr:hypothetical protein [Bradyrhizobium sp. SSUT77]MDH2347082.1 hypothetical protein [Bradyrhizobium sp. SSUT77]
MANIGIGDKGQFGLWRWQLIMTLLHEPPDSLDCVLAADVSCGPCIANIPKCKRGREHRAATRKLEIVRRCEIDEFPWDFIDHIEQRVNFGAVDIGNGTAVDLRSAWAEHAVNGAYDLARKNF